jgi:LPXTG-site transpeptidase (sortase) family protein
MNGIIDATVRLIQAGKRAFARKRDFFGLFVVVFLVSILALGQIGLLPDMPPAPAASLVALDPSAVTSAHTEQTTTVELPVKIEIPKINLSASIANPTTTDIAILDQGLLKGAVRYPTSAELGEDGNVVLFGHSSYLPIVGNQAYKTFDGIQKLVAGDIVTVYSSDTAYTYRVESVAKESANDAGIPLSVTGRVLTLSTCDSFGSKTDRFIVVANFVDSYPVST